MGTCFHLVDVPGRRYFALEKFLPRDEHAPSGFESIFIDMPPSGPHGEHTWEALERACCHKHYGRSLSETKARELFDFLESCGWKVKLYADTSEENEYFRCYRDYDCVGSVYDARRGQCRDCGWVGVLLDDPICARCDWKET